MAKLRYANTEIDFTVERLVEIASKAIDGLLEDDRESAIEYLVGEVELDDYEMKFFGVIEREEDDDEYYGYDEDNDEYYDDEEEWRDDSYVGCSDCPDDECTGHCMSCSYRPV